MFALCTPGVGVFDLCTPGVGVFDHCTPGVGVFDLCTPGVGILVGSSESGGGTGISPPPQRKSFPPQKQHGLFFC